VKKAFYSVLLFVLIRLTILFRGKHQTVSELTRWADSYKSDPVAHEFLLKLINDYSQ
jgi:hypothetical protein